MTSAGTTPVVGRNRVARVFVSSTFQDMQAERDELSFRVFPELRARCRERGISLIDVDLRWGITEEQEIRGEVLPLCLAQIDESRPFFVGLLGQRYGSVLPRFDQAMIDTHPWLAEHRDNSLTEIEFLHGCLREPGLDRHAFFYFRSPAYLDQLPADERARYGEEDANRSQQLESLKQSVRDAGFPVVEDYEDCESLGDRILEDLWGAICSIPGWGVPEHGMAQLAGPTFDFLEFHVEREAERRITDHVSAGKGGLVLTGPPGIGKTAMLAAWVRKQRSQNPGVRIFESYEESAGQGDRAARNLTQRLSQWLKLELPAGSLADNRTNANIAAALEQAAAKEPVVLVLDGLDRIDSDAMGMTFSFLPSPLPPNLSVLCTARPGRFLEITEHRGWAQIEIAPLSKDQIDQLIRSYFERWGKQLDEARRVRLAGHALAGTPLYLRTMLEALRVGTLHAELDQRIAELREAEDPPALFRQILERLEQRFEPAKRGVLRLAMQLLYASRNGLLETELLQILTQELTTDAGRTWSSIFFALQESLTLTEGRVAFRHDEIREAVRAMFIDSDDDLQESRRLLIDHFQQTEDAIRRLEELPWQLREAGRFEELRDCVASPEILCGLWDERMLSDLFDYWATLAPKFEFDQAFSAALDSLESSQAPARDCARYARIAGLFFVQLKSFEAAIRFLERAIEHIKTADGWDSERIVFTMAALSLALLEQRKYEEAIAAARRALAICHRRFGPEHPQTAEAMNCLAMPLAKAGEKSARAVFERALELTRKLQGENHPDVIAVLDNMATYLPDDPGSIRRHREALEVSERSTGPESVETAKCLDNLARALLAGEEFKEAHALAERALAIWERERGLANADTRVCLDILLHSALGIGELLGAARVFSQLLDACHAEPPDDLGDFLGSVLLLDQHLSGRGHFRECETLLRSYVSLAERQFGAVDCEAQIALGHVCRENAALDESEALFRSAATSAKHSRLTESQNRCRAMIGLSKVLKDKRQVVESMQCLEEGLDIIRTADEPDAFLESECYNLLAQTAIETDDLESAERWSTKAIDSFAANEEPDHPSVGVMLDLRARILLARNRLDEAESASREAVAKLEKLTSPESVHTLSALHNLGTIRYHQGELDDAEELLRRAMETRARVLGPTHLHTQNSRSQLAVVLRDKGNYEESLALTETTGQASDASPAADRSFPGRQLFIAQNLLDTQKPEEAERAFRDVLAAVDAENGEDIEVAYAGYTGLGRSLSLQDKHEDAERVFRQALELVSRADGATTDVRMESLENLARVLSAQGKYEEAEAQVRSCIEIARGGGIRVGHIALLEFELAEAITLQGDHERALAVYERSMRTLDDEPDVSRELRDRMDAAVDLCRRRCEAGIGAKISSLLDRGEGLLTKQRFDEAEAPVQEAATLAKANPDIPAGLLGRSLTTLSALQRERGDLAAAEAACREALELHDMTTQEGISNAAVGYSNLAFLLADQGKHEEVAQSLRTVQGLVKRTDGMFDNQFRFNTIERLAVSLIEIGEEREAADLLADTVDANAEVFRTGDPQAVAIFFMLARSFKGRYSTVVADALVSRVNELVPRDSGIWPLIGGYSSYLHANICIEQGRVDEAVRHYEEVLEAMGMFLTPDVLDSDRDLPQQLDWAATAAIFLAEHRDRPAERWDRALANYRLAERLKERVGEHYAALDVELKIHLMRLEAGRPIDLHRVRELAEPLEKWIAEYPDVDPVDRATGFSNLALPFRQLGALGEAEALCRKALDVDEQHRESDHPQIAHRLVNLGLVLIVEGKFEEAEDCIDRAWQIQTGRRDAVSVRTLVTRVLIQMLSESPIDEPINELRSVLLARDGFSNEHTSDSWDMTDVLVHLDSQLDSNDAALVAALVDAFNDRSKLAELDEFDVWRDPSSR